MENLLVFDQFPAFADTIMSVDNQRDLLQNFSSNAKNISSVTGWSISRSQGELECSSSCYFVEESEFVLTMLKEVKKMVEAFTQYVTQMSTRAEETEKMMHKHLCYLINLNTSQHGLSCSDLDLEVFTMKTNLFRLNKILHHARNSILLLLEDMGNQHEVSHINIEDMGNQHINIVAEQITFTNDGNETDFGKIFPKTSLSSTTEVPRNLDNISLHLDEGAVDVDVNPAMLRQLEQAAVDIAYLTNGDLVVCKDDDLQLYDASGCEVHHFFGDSHQQSLGELWSASTGRRVSKLAVTECRDSGIPGILHLYTLVEDTWLHSSYEVCEEPQSVGVTSCGGYVIYSGEWKLYKYNPTCQQVWSVDLLDVVIDLFVDDNDDRIFVVVSDNVVIFNSYGQRIASLPETEKLVQPSGVCVDGSGQVIVCEKQNRCILLFDASYQFVRSIVSLDIVPSGVSLYKDKMLSVCGQGKVIVYKYRNVLH